MDDNNNISSPLVTEGSRNELQSCLEDTIEQYIGDFGWSQLFQVVIVSFVWIFDSQQAFISIFTDAQPQWHCVSWSWDLPLQTSIVSEWSLQCAGSMISGMPASAFYMVMSLAGFVSGFGRANIRTCSIVLSSELVGKRWRGFLSLPLIAYLNKESSWRVIYLWTCTPAILYCFLVYLLFFERKWAIRRLMTVMILGFGVGLVYFGNWNAIRANRRIAVLGFSIVCAAFDVLLIYTLELFPTCIRNSAVTIVRQMMTFGGATSPLLVAIGRGEGAITYLVFGSVVGLCGLFVGCLPETRGETLCDTMDEEEIKENRRKHTALANEGV
ncbi:hypothetical protein DCAR_0310908 [Daucus carota subsp. sativus]|uniref:Major facilitator superfamily (MFS) profile domain-containing protein n=1 Tax=Daucus carota subsp. sativus TaxID=79200 RepID=A0AAF0WNR7_DAUCS|nr:hypothetical protein DCAR_0310908 [Daucus carota subsp. sativus]